LRISLLGVDHHLISTPRPTRTWMAQLGQRGGKESWRDDVGGRGGRGRSHYITVDSRGCQWSLGRGVVEGWKSIVQVFDFGTTRDQPCGFVIPSIGTKHEGGRDRDELRAARSSCYSIPYSHSTYRLISRFEYKLAVNDEYSSVATKVCGKI
jgi:hypothetical protein